MADQPAPKKRIVKNPETFRERALKASEAEAQPDRGTRVKQAGGRVLSPVARPVGKAGRQVGSLKPVRWLGKLLRLIGRILLPRYFRNSWQELRQVKWPSWRESRRLTFAVLAFAIVFGAAIAIVDYGLDKLFKNVLLK